MTAETEKLELRPWQIEDAACVALYADNEKIARNLRDVFPHPYRLQDAEGFIRECLKADESREMFRTIAVDGCAVGGISLVRGEDVYRRSAELGYWLAEPCWGRGIMTRAVRQICQEGFDAWEIVRIYACPYASNAGSRRVLEKAGFALEGVLRQAVYKNGAVLDGCVYGLLRPQSPAERTD